MSPGGGGSGAKRRRNDVTPAALAACRRAEARRARSASWSSVGLAAESHRAGSKQEGRPAATPPSSLAASPVNTGESSPPSWTLSSSSSKVKRIPPATWLRARFLAALSNIRSPAEGPPASTSRAHGFRKTGGEAAAACTRLVGAAGLGPAGGRVTGPPPWAPVPGGAGQGTSGTADRARIPAPGGPKTEADRPKTEPERPIVGASSSTPRGPPTHPPHPSGIAPRTGAIESAWESIRDRKGLVGS